ncbi:MAG: cell division protein, partial [Flavobacteriales bacterium]|nr:cell division protein [Flavobacteriales bacterium]
MPKIILHTEIKAPRKVVFNLSRSIDLHLESTAQTREQAIAGKTSGMMELGEQVTWKAKHFG